MQNCRLRRTARLVWPVLLCLAICGFGQSQTDVFRLASIKVTGLERFVPENIVFLSGLKIDQNISLPDIQTAVRKLAESGYLRSVKYSYSYNMGLMDLEFQVVESIRFLPCVFDNFVWFKHDEILKAVRSRIPMFDRNLPPEGSASQEVTRALQDLLRSRNLPGTVTTMLSQDQQSGGPPRLVFRASGIDLPIRKLVFPACKAVSEAELQEKAKGLLGQQYSEIYATKFAHQTLAQLFRKKGHLRIQFKDPSLRIEVASPTEHSLTLILEPVEGLAYRWDGAVWTGDGGLSADELRRVPALRPGDIADGTAVDQGLAAVKEMLGKRGHVAAKIQADPEYDDTEQKVRFTMQISAGPQYRMGSVTFKGVQESVAQQLRSLWRLKPGDVFDASYPNDFVNKAARVVIDAVHLELMSASVHLDSEKRTAEMIFAFK
jgi:outer membrane protein insertion porin family